MCHVMDIPLMRKIRPLAYILVSDKFTTYISTGHKALTLHEVF